MNRVAIALAVAIAALALTSSGSAGSNPSTSRAWAATAIPQARLEIAGEGPRQRALLRRPGSGCRRPAWGLPIPHLHRWLMGLVLEAGGEAAPAEYGPGESHGGGDFLGRHDRPGRDRSCREQPIRCLCLPRLVAASLDSAGDADREAHERRGPGRLRLRCRAVVRRDDSSRRRPGGSGRLSCRDCGLVAG